MKKFGLFILFLFVFILNNSVVNAICGDNPQKNCVGSHQYCNSTFYPSACLDCSSWFYGCDCYSCSTYTTPLGVGVIFISVFVGLVLICIGSICLCKRKMKNVRLLPPNPLANPAFAQQQQQNPQINNFDSNLNTPLLYNNISSAQIIVYYTYNFFINYRVNTDSDTAEKLYWMLSVGRRINQTNQQQHYQYLYQQQQQQQQQQIHVFLDKFSLKVGEAWEQGFTQGLQSSFVIILVISENGIKSIEEADQKPDNVLLEYEYALQKYSEGKCHILPLFVGEYIVDERLGKVFKKFGAFDASNFPENLHCHKLSHSQLNIRQVMTRLFKLQGIFVANDTITSEDVRKAAFSLLDTPFERHPEFSLRLE